MMHRCSSSCSCGMYNQSSDYSSGYSMLFATPNTNNNNQINHNQYYDNQSIYSSSDYDNQSIYSSSSSSVDCTLSLGTPSTRLSTNANDRPPSESRRSLSSAHKSGRGGGTDPLVTRRCANCDTTSTPLWRNGPRGPKSLCNACGIRFKKEERRASAAAAAASANGGGAGGMDVMHNSWVPHQTQMPYNNYSSTSAAYGNEYGYMEDDDRDSAFLSWRLNVHCS